ncbi:MAG: polyprenyl synthetase family protein [bacterium]
MLDDMIIKSRVSAINKQIALIHNTKSKSIKSIFKNIKFTSGKRLRGLLVLLTAEANGLKVNKALLNIAASIEILHHATLIHDDIVDGSDKRRGNLALNKKIGETLSVLTGDYLFSGAMEAMLKSRNYELFNIFAKAVKDVCEGEIDEVFNKYNAKLTVSESLEIIRKKTASLIKGSVESGAHASKCSKTDLKHIKIYGEYLGMAFQIKDDLLDITSKTSKIGKSSGTDIREGKATLPLILALKCAPKKEKHFIMKLFKNNIHGKNTKKIIDFIFKYDGNELAGLMALSYVTDAKVALGKTKLENKVAKEMLSDLADYVIEREY